MSLVAAPGVTIYPSVDWGTTGSTLGVRLRRDSDGLDVVARTVVGVVEDFAGVYVQRAGMTTPTVAGEYTIAWDDTIDFVTEDLTVSYSAQAAVAPSGIDLCTVADVRLWLGKKANETSDDTSIAADITAASRAIMDYAEREFATTVTNPAVRTLEKKLRDGCLDLAPYDLQSATLVRLHAETASPLTLAANLDYVLRPYDKRHGVYTKLELYGGVPLVSDLGVRFGFVTVEITGTWGFVTVPTPVKMACVETVVAWLRRSGGFSPAFNSEEEGAVERPQNIPGAARMKLAPYMRGGFR